MSITRSVPGTAAAVVASRLVLVVVVLFALPAAPPPDAADPPWTGWQVSISDARQTGHDDDCSSQERKQR